MPATGSAGRKPAASQRLYINVDHVATLRQARRGADPDPVAAAALCEEAGADGITAHLREDRRHMQDADIDRLAASVRTVFNLEMANTDEMVALALRLRPHQVTIVPERRHEVTTEGGLDVSHEPVRLAETLERLRERGIRTSLFVDPDPAVVRRSRELGADAVELHTGRFAHDPGATTLAELTDAAKEGVAIGVAVHAGHGLTVGNVGPVAAIAGIEELNIGHSVISRAVFVGLAAAIQELATAMRRARA